MKVLMVIQSRADASARVRALAWRRTLDAMQIESAVAEAAPGRRERGELVRQAGAADVVFVQRKLFNRWDMRSLRKAAKRLVFDFDDAIFMRDDHSGTKRSATRATRFNLAVDLADTIIAGNAYLAEHVPARFRDKVMVIPSVADTGVYTPASDERPSTPPTVGWIGSASTLPYLEAVAAPLARVQDAARCRVVVVADRAPDMPGVEVEFHSWSLEKEVDEIRAMDVGIMPLPDSPWTRGKCGYKLILYLACGVPAVASPVGVNADVIAHEQSGFLAGDDGEWEQALLQVLRDAHLRKQFGERGRADMIEQYSIDAWKERFLEAVSQ